MTYGLTMCRAPRRTQSLSAISALVVLCVAFWASPAAAYRPFDGTDAAVADPNEMEIEFQPVGALWQSSNKSLVGPWAVLNYGFADRWEAVLEGKGIIPLSPSGPFEMTDTAFSLKNVVVPGSLQDRTGPSVATEIGLLLPEVHGDSSRFGASLTGIVSQRWDWGTVHFNAAALLTRQQTGEAFTSIIIEGPAKWTVRPVAEVFYEQEINQSTTISGLIGLIWQVRDNLSFDVAFRHAITDGHPIDEIRAGTTFGFPLGPMMAGRR
jgi:hypothetical protein